MPGVIDAYAERKYQQVQRDTWGHLAPVARRVYQGYMVFTLGAYGDITLIDARWDGLDDSPWLFEDMQDYIADRAQESGTVYRFDGTYTMYKNGGHRFSGKVTALYTAA